VTPSITETGKKREKSEASEDMNDDQASALERTRNKPRIDHFRANSPSGHIDVDTQLEGHGYIQAVDVSREGEFQTQSHPHIDISDEQLQAVDRILEMSPIQEVRELFGIGFGV
jgi:hypothetical protein